MRAAIYVCMGLPTVTRRRSNAYPSCIATDPFFVPQLFIWSKRGDPLVPAEHIQGIIETRRKQLGSACVLDWSLEHSPHVMHIHTDRDGYQNAVQSFLLLVRKVVDPTLNLY